MQRLRIRVFLRLFFYVLLDFMALLLLVKGISLTFIDSFSLYSNFIFIFLFKVFISFLLFREETFPVVLPKALHLFEKLIQHGTIKANLIWQLFIVNLSTLHNAISTYYFSLFFFLALFVDFVIVYSDPKKN